MRWFTVGLAVAAALCGGVAHGQKPWVTKPAAGKPQALAPRGWAITLPFELLDSGHMAIRVKVNGAGPYRVIFDTGAPAVMFSGRAAKEGGAIDKDRTALMLGSYGPARFERVQVGDFGAENVPGEVMDHPTVGQLAAKLGPIDGLVGFPLFTPARLTIDYQARTITFVPRPPPAGDEPDADQAAREMFRGKPKAVTVAPAGQWGLVVGERKEGQAGADVTSVWAGGAAAEGGLRAGDRLLTIGGRWTDSVEDVYRAAGAAPAGKAVTVTVRRDGKELELKVTPRAGL